VYSNTSWEIVISRFQRVPGGGAKREITTFLGMFKKQQERSFGRLDD
jgi:hypothetical protein